MYNKQVIDGEVDVKKLAYEEIMWTSQEKFSAKSWSKLHIKGNVYSVQSTLYLSAH